jgi:glutathione S-transferase
MRKLYHYWLSPFSRQIRLCLAEKGLQFEPILEKQWERRAEFLSLNPSGEVPVLIENEKDIICEAGPIAEYLDEVYPDRPMMGRDPNTRAEVRRLISWFNHKFYAEVSVNLLEEKTIKAHLTGGAPNSAALRAGAINLNTHLTYISYLVERRTWLAGDRISMADLCAAAHLSCLDYFGDVPWDKHSEAKDWYARIKSRPSFRSILLDSVPGMIASRHYTNLDF